MIYLYSTGETNWLIVATGVADCYYNVVDLPAGGSFRFRVACVNKAGQGPYSNLSEVVSLDATGMYYIKENRGELVFILDKAVKYTLCCFYVVSDVCPYKCTATEKD